MAVFFITLELSDEPSASNAVSNNRLHSLVDCGIAGQTAAEVSRELRGWCLLVVGTSHKRIVCPPPLVWPLQSETEWLRRIENIGCVFEMTSGYDGSNSRGLGLNQLTCYRCCIVVDLGETVLLT